MFALMVASATAAKSIDDYAEESVSRLSAYLKIDTINPPGNESRGVGYLSKILESEGIAYEVVESAPNRGNLWSRLRSAKPSGSRDALVLLHHIDVVPANRFVDKLRSSS